MSADQQSEASVDSLDMAGFGTVGHWVGAYARHWTRKQSEVEVTRRLEVLRHFCQFCGMDPDTLVRDLFRETPAGPRIRLKMRREVMAQINAFEAMVAEGNVRRGREMGNVVRSFLIHNGVALSATPLR